MKSCADARALAQALVAGAAANKRRAAAVLSDMSQPLGRCVGNALEVREALEALDVATQSRAEPRLRELCLTLAAEGLALATGEPKDAARRRVEAALESGAAHSAFVRLIRAQGGDPARLAEAPEQLELPASASGWVGAVAAESVGKIVVALGGGRAKKEDIIDARVGIEILSPVGSRVEKGQPLARIHAASREQAQVARQELEAAIGLSDVPVSAPPLIGDVLYP
jgi:thymidine phosphorylase